MARKKELILRGLALFFSVLWFAGLAVFVAYSGEGNTAAGWNSTNAMLICWAVAHVGGPIVATLLSRQVAEGHGCAWTMYALLIPGFSLPVLALRRIRQTLAFNTTHLREKDDVPGLIKALHCNKPAYIRSNAARALAEIGGAEVVGQLITTLRGKEAQSRAAAAEALGQVDVGAGAIGLRPRIVAALTAALGDTQADVRSRAVWALGQVGGREAEEAVSRALNDSYPSVRRAAARALTKIGSAAAVNPLVGSLEDGVPQVRRYAAEALGRICAGSDDEVLRRLALPALLNSLADGDAGVRKYAAEMLGVVRDPEAVDPLIALLKDRDGGARSGAALGLGLLGDARAVEPLVAALRDRAPGVRWGAAVALGRIADQRAEQALATAAQDGDARVRQAAAAAMETLRQP